MPHDPIARELKSIYRADKKLLEQTQVPIFTVSASFVEDLKGLHHHRERDTSTDIVLSRAHYSMALGVAIQAWGKQIDPQKAWLVDSTNYVGTKAFQSVKLTHLIGKTIARWPILKSLKDLVDKFGRSKMPILDSVTPPTIYLGSGIQKPILSMHIVTGNILASEGKKVVQMITDPHIRSDYLQNAHLPNMRFLVFDEATKADFFKVAKNIGKKIPTDQIANKVIVTGPPIDPRIVACNTSKTIWDTTSPLRLCLTTGGLGTNKNEIHQLLEQLLPILQRQDLGDKTDLIDTRLVFYAGTQRDHVDMAIQIAEANKLNYQLISPKDPASFAIGDQIVSSVGSVNSVKSDLDKHRFSIIYHPQIVDANELLITKAMPWADLFISKPSGDMAYDAVVSGAALLTLKEWGEWEHNVRAVFEKNGTAQIAETDQIVAQLIKITSNQSSSSWLAQAMHNSKKLPSNFYHGAENILKAVSKDW